MSETAATVKTAAQRQTPFWLGIDLGGTNIKAGVVDDHGVARSSVSLPTEADKGPDHGIERMAEAGRLAIAQAGLTVQEIAALGIGSPGPMDLAEQKLMQPANLPLWVNVPLPQRVGSALGIAQHVLQNDANAAALGEYWVGAGRAAHSMVQFTLGTGIGCGIVLNGQIVEGAHSHGGEAGHQRIDINANARRHPGTGLYGTLESYASATAVVDRTREKLEAGTPSSLQALLKPAEALTAKAIFDAADAGDALAQEIVEQTAFYLAVGTVNLMHIINPEIIVYSGGLIHAGEPFLERVRHYIRENALPLPRDRTQVVYAALGNEAGIIGAAGCARSKFGTSLS